MNMKKQKLSILGGVLLFFGIMVTGTNAFSAMYYFGETADPAGDALTYNEKSIDLIYASISVNETAFSFSARFSPGTFLRMEASILFGLDTDQNPETGFYEMDAEGKDLGVIGIDYLVEYFPNAGWVSANHYQDGFFYPVNATTQIFFSDDGIDFSIPRSWLGDDEGLVDFKVYASLAGVPGDHGYLDTMTDFGEPAAYTSPVPIPGTFFLMAAGLLGCAGIRKKQ